MPPLALAAYSSVDVGELHSVALATDGTVWTSGSNSYGQLGDGTTNASTGRVQATHADGTPLTGMTAVAAAGYFSAALRNDGTVWAWGDNRYGQLGDGTIVNRSRAVQTRQVDGTALAGIGGISAGGGVPAGHLLAVASGGAVWAVGSGAVGQLGNGANTASSLAVRSTFADGSLIANATSVAAGGRFSLVVLSTGAVWGFGHNKYGFLGDGTTTDRARAVQATYANGTPLANMTAAAAGGRGETGDYAHSVVLRNDGTVWTFGINNFGQLGNGGASSNCAGGHPCELRAVQATYVGGTPLAGITAIGAGNRSTYARRNDGTAWSFGSNGYGELSIGSTSSSNRAAQMVGSGGSPLANVANMTGAYHVLGTRSDGTAFAAGGNGSGQYGDCTITSNTSAVVAFACGPPAGNVAPSAPAGLAQRRSDGVTVIPAAAWTNQSTVVLKFDVSDPDASQTLTPWVEVRTDTAFAGTCGTAGTGMYSGTAVSAPTAGTPVSASVTVTGLTENSTWYWRACAVDQGAAVSPWTASGGAPDFRVDLTAPTNPTTINDGTGADIDWIASTTSLSANWSGATDTPSGIANYDWCFTTDNLNDCGATGLVASGAALATASVTASGLTLTQGTIYYACIRSRDNAGNITASFSCSNGQRPDTVNPNPPGTVNDGTGADIDNQASSTTLDANWSAGSDTAPGVVADYEFCFATATGCTGTVVATGFTAATSASPIGLTLTVWATYYACARTRDGAGNLGAWVCSDGVLIDGTLTLSIASYETVALGLQTPGTPTYGETRATVTTDAPNGYTLALHDSDANGALYDGTNNVPWNTSGTVAGPGAWTGTGVGVSAFGGSATPARWCSGGQVNCTTIDDADLLWAQPTNTSQTISSASAPITNDTTRIPIRLTVPATQPPNSYSGTIAITAVALP